MSGRAGVIVGADLVRVSHIADSVERFGDRFLGRFFTAQELADCMVTPETSHARLAARFAAKEATRKVLGLKDDGVDWRSMEVRRLPDGAPALVLHGVARELAARAGLTALSLSLSHEDEYSLAVVVAERRAPPESFRIGRALRTRGRSKRGT